MPQEEIGDVQSVETAYFSSIDIPTDVGSANADRNHQINGNTQAIEELFKEAILVDVSEDKQWIAYVVKRTVPCERSAEENNTTTTEMILKFARFMSGNTGDLHLSFPTALVEHNVGILDPLSQYDTSYSLSISPDGKKAAFSGFQFPFNTRLINIQDKDGEISTTETTVKFAGKIICLEDDKFAFLDPNVLTIRRYGKTTTVLYQFDITSISTFTLVHSMNNSISSYNVPTVYYGTHYKKTEKLMKNMVILSKYLKQGMMVSYSDDGSFIWSINKNGILLSASKSPLLKEVLAISLNSKFVATIDPQKNCIDILESKTSLKINSLKINNSNISSLKTKPDDNHSQYECQYHGSFCSESLLFFLITVMDRHFISFQVWNIFAGKTILYKKEALNASEPTPTAVIEPFVMEGAQAKINTSRFWAVYPLVLEDGRRDIKSIELEVYPTSSELPRGWEISSIDNGSIILEKAYEAQNTIDLIINEGQICLFHPFDSDTGKTLVYIRAFKPIIEALGGPSSHFWYRKTRKSEEPCVPSVNLGDHGIRLQEVEDTLRIIVDLSPQSNETNGERYWDEIYLPVDSLAFKETEGKTFYVNGRFFFLTALIGNQETSSFHATTFDQSSQSNSSALTGNQETSISHIGIPDQASQFNSISESNFDNFSFMNQTASTTSQVLTFDGFEYHYLESFCLALQRYWWLS